MSRPLTLSIISDKNLSPPSSTSRELKLPIGGIFDSTTNLTQSNIILPLQVTHVSPIQYPIAPIPNLVIQPNIPIPNFNHSPIVPVIVPKPAPTIVQNQINKPLGRQLSAEEREARRAEQQRLSNARYRDKVRKYKNLGTVQGEKEKIKGMILLCYPHLEEMDPLELDSKIDQFVRSLHA